jgi:AmmeMemoRadiSam system protein A
MGFADHFETLSDKGYIRPMDLKETSAHLTEAQGQVLLRLARATIAARLGLSDAASTILPAQELADPAFQEQRGTFVTLKIRDQLRGCMGCLTPSETILEGIQRNAVNAAFNDPRFPPLTAPELEQAEIEVSILTSPRELEYAGGSDLLKKLRANIDGAIISQGMARATFLPQVWEQLPRAEEFLAHLCRKAGLSPDEWKKGELGIETYQVQYFHEKR